ncbi:hypothetical protein ACFQL7_20710 [Halocatena marina]|uniref:RanBP2-type domain-containing protein n=1 Tax=Halocatena marina TaxID=2934937 RepID=A0ABD5YRN0_9EURY|nr:hypothetical protein [Halocatena marina]
MNLEEYNEEKPWQCPKCGAKGEFSDDCALCRMEEDYEENKELYQAMGEL